MISYQFNMKQTLGSSITEPWRGREKEREIEREREENDRVERKTRETAEKRERREEGGEDDLKRN